MKKKRLDYVKALRAHWSVKVGFWIWALLGAGSTALTYAPQSWQNRAYVGQYLPKLSLSTWIIGTLLLLLVFFFEAAFKVYTASHELQQASTITRPAPVPVHIGNSSSAGGNATATAKSGDIYIGTLPPVPPPPVSTEPDDAPILSFEESQNIFLADTGWVWIEHSDGLPVLVAVFRNRIRGVGIPTPIAHQVSAHLTFRSKAQTVSVDHGAWVGEYTYFAEFKPNDVRKLVVAVIDQNQVFGEKLLFIRP
jgi:hypothetical protein